MIIVQIQGGLGNQMFQYAAARAAAERLGTELLLDIGWYGIVPSEIDTPRKYELNIFKNINAGTASKSQLEKLYPTSFPAKVRRRLARRIPLLSEKQVIREQGAGFSDCLHNLISGRDFYVLGYYQSEKYFSDQSELIRKYFAFPEIEDGQNSEMLQMIRSGKNTVSLHVRRGDYVSLPAAAAYHGGICTLDYYSRAASALAEKLGSPHFIIFSDEPEWAKANLALPGRMSCVDWNKGADSFRDMQLMSECSHHIVANSSFSWWGSWLGKNPDKIVCAPSRWFAQSAFDNPDILPEKWVKIHV